MTAESLEALVSTEWLADHLSDADVKILDCTWYHESTNLDGRTQYRGRHLPGSVHFDIDHIADKSSSLPHMLPTALDFAKKVGLLGVSSSNRVIVYDRHCGGAAAARAWWMFRVFGHKRVAMLDGGFGKWAKEKLPAEMTPVRPEPQTFTATFAPSLVRDLARMQENLTNKTEQVIDARGPAKFDGTQEDVFPFKRLGHIPGSINLPWGDLIHPETGAFIEADTLAVRFAQAGIDLQRPIVSTCASGTLSCVIALGLYLLGHPDAAVYDGAWAEWSQASDTPAEATAPAGE
jgi:thiosulfate/3-mercaptopyruvate sulfurtransferase